MRTSFYEADDSLQYALWVVLTRERKNGIKIVTVANILSVVFDMIFLKLNCVRNFKSLALTVAEISSGCFNMLLLKTNTTPEKVCWEKINQIQ